LTIENEGVEIEKDRARRAMLKSIERLKTR
jgi:hypothetical protein